MKTGKINILCVDDEKYILNALGMLLGEKYNVLTTAYPEDAIHLLKTYPVAVIISDQRMPEMLGVELLTIAKSISPHTTRILLTGFADMDAIIDSVNHSEVYRFINKPWDNEQLLHIIEESVVVYQTLSNGISIAPIEKATEQSLSEPIYIIYKSENEQAIQSLRATLSPNIHLLWAQSTTDIMDLLSHPISILVIDIKEDDLNLLRVLKKELPHLLTITIVPSANYSELVSMINEIKIYRYIIAPAKASQINFFIGSAVKLSQSFKTQPALLQQQQTDNPLQHKEYSASIFNKIHALFK